jgi:hypothetical protein
MSAMHVQVTDMGFICERQVMVAIAPPAAEDVAGVVVPQKMDLVLDDEAIRAEFGKYSLHKKIKVLKYILNKFDAWLLDNDDRYSLRYRDSVRTIEYMFGAIGKEMAIMSDVGEKVNYIEDIDTMKLQFDALQMHVMRGRIRSFWCS